MNLKNPFLRYFLWILKIVKSDFGFTKRRVWNKNTFTKIFFASFFFFIARNLLIKIKIELFFRVFAKFRSNHFKGTLSVFYSKINRFCFVFENIIQFSPKILILVKYRNFSLGWKLSPKFRFSIFDPNFGCTIQIRFLTQISRVILFSPKISIEIWV